MHKKTDLVVVGYGAAGIAAAITAARAGAKVALLEKQSEDTHFSSSRMSGGLIMGATDVEGATRYLDQCADGMIPTEINRAWAERAVCVRQWLESVGIKSVRMAGAWYPKFDGYEAIEVLAPLPKGTEPEDVEIELPKPGELTFKFPLPFGNGALLHDLLLEAVAKEPNIEACFEHEATKLIQDGSRVVGIECMTPDGEVTIDSRYGVVLSCGGYEKNQDMILNYLKAYPIYFYGSEANTGDGIRMAQSAGADLWHMNQMIGRGVGHFKHPDGWETTLGMSLNPPGYVILDKYGERFANEHLQAVSKPNFYYELLKYDADRLEYPRIPSYWIFDKRRLEARPLAHGGIGYYQWSKDNRTEIDLGWIKEADTVEEVARLAGIDDPEAAAQSINTYNEYCQAKEDPFGRPEDSLVPIDQPPYYCVKIYPGGATTNGGPRRDAHARILNAHREPIPGLFGAGELGGAIGLLYPSPGSNLGEAIAFGEMAAETAIREGSQ